MASHLLHKCILGALGHTTRLLCTHRTEYLEKADIVLLMENGRLVQAGTVGYQGGRGSHPPGYDRWIVDCRLCVSSMCGLGLVIILSSRKPSPSFTELV